MRARLVRPAVLLGAVGLVASAGLAGAAPAACNLVSDAKGDAGGFVITDPAPLPSNPQLDLVSGDIATKGKTITAVIRTAELGATDSQAPTGRAYYANFDAAGATLFLAVRIDGTGAASYTGGFIENTRTSLGPATGVIDTAKKEIRISAPLSLFNAQAAIKDGTAIQNLNLLAQRFVGAAGAGATPSADDALGGKTYTAGSPSCVPVGK